MKPEVLICVEPSLGHGAASPDRTEASPDPSHKQRRALQTSISVPVPDERHQRHIHMVMTSNQSYSSTVASPARSHARHSGESHAGASWRDACASPRSRGSRKFESIRSFRFVCKNPHPCCIQAVKVRGTCM